MEVNILTAFPRDSSLNHLKIGMVLYWRMGQRQGKCVYHNVVGGMAIMHLRYYWSQRLGLILARTACPGAWRHPQSMDSIPEHNEDL